MPAPARPYNAPRRRASAAATRDSIVTAARSLLAERGWAGTTTREIARAAGVAEPTIYATFGSKAAVAKAIVDDIAGSADHARQAAELAAAQGDPRGQLAAMIGFDRRLYEYGADVLIALRDAGDPELSNAYRTGRAEGDRLRRRIMRGWPTATLRLSRPEARATYAALCNVDVYCTLRTERDWSPDRIERWLHRTVCRLLLCEAQTPGRLR